MFQTTNQLWFQIASHFLAPLDERWSEKVGVPELRRFFLCPWAQYLAMCGREKNLKPIETND